MRFRVLEVAAKLGSVQPQPDFVAPQKPGHERRVIPRMDALSGRSKAGGFDSASQLLEVLGRQDRRVVASLGKPQIGQKSRILGP